MKIAVVGATGMVGEVMLQVLAERNFITAADELILVASERSVGKEIAFNGKNYSVVGLETAVSNPTTGIIISSTAEPITLLNAPPITTAVAKLKTSPFIKEALKSLKNPISFLLLNL